ncbi:1052_t:CDS:1 [Paraglomus occultum]|uniref:1052_t:CDS:1 n=1 Tax=Paraglomus occultum TaxID=144539 RepID=A0A9N9FYZ4_9GLOM|nr:1052_t:CDS:1 [Paraglomus occultum]
MVRKIIAALILLAMLSTLNAMPNTIVEKELVWKKCNDKLPMPNVQSNVPIPGKNVTVTISGEVPDKSAQYKWSFSYINLKGEFITYSYKGATVSLCQDSTHYTVTGTAKVSDKVAAYERYNFVIRVRSEADEKHEKPTYVACATALVVQKTLPPN